jgi:hypothetical protein
MFTYSERTLRFDRVLFVLLVSAPVCSVEFRPDNRIIRSADNLARRDIDVGIEINK